jgi:hypothetical protein
MAAQPPHESHPHRHPHHHEDDKPWRAEAVAIGVVAVVALALILFFRPWTNRSQPYSAATVLIPAAPSVTAVPISR